MTDKPETKIDSLAEDLGSGGIMMPAYIYDFDYVTYFTDKCGGVRSVAREGFLFPRLQSLFPAQLSFFAFASILHFFYSKIQYQPQKSSHIEVVDSHLEQKILPEFKCQKKQQHLHFLCIAEIKKYSKKLVEVFL